MTGPVSVFQGLAQESTARLGRHDDGHEGLIVTKIAQGGLVRVPLSTQGIYSAAGAGSTSVVGTSAQPSNPDGTGNQGVLTAAALTTAWAAYEQTVWGNQVGVRYQRDNAATRAPFAVIIDGVVHKVSEVKNRNVLGAVMASTDYEALAMVADDLGPGPHAVRVVVYGDASGAQTRVVNLLGFVAESNRGYLQPGPSYYIPTIGDAATVPTVAAAIPYGGRAQRIHLVNTSATTARTVTIRKGSNIYATRALAIGADADVDFGLPLSLSGWTWQVDAGTDVKGTTITGAAGL